METAVSILELSFRMGETLLESGAEISRVQETMERVAKSYHADKLDVYVLTNAIFASGSEKGVPRSTQLKYVKSPRTHLGRVSAVNQLSREIAECRLSPEEAYARLEEIRAIPYTRLPVATVCCVITAASYSFLFGGSVMDAAAAALCGLFLEPLLHLIEKKQMSRFLSNLISSAFVALLACSFYLLGLGDNPDKIIIGTIIRLVPGVALTNSIRDFFGSDYLSGAIRMIDALIVGGCIGIGVGFVIRMFSIVTGGVLI